eukprot:551892-Amphidinium_carterae.1
MAPVPNTGGTTKVLHSSPSKYTSEEGYLVAKADDEVQLLYLGNGESRGWVFARLVQTELQGWLPVDTILDVGRHSQGKEQKGIVDERDTATPSGGKDAAVARTAALSPSRPSQPPQQLQPASTSANSIATPDEQAQPQPLPHPPKAG